MSRVNRVVPALFLSVNRLKTLCYGCHKAVPTCEIGEIPNGYYPSIVKDNSALLRSPGRVNASALCRGLAYALPEQWYAAVLCTGKGLAPFHCLRQLSPSCFDQFFIFAYMVEVGNLPNRVLT